MNRALRMLFPAFRTSSEPGETQPKHSALCEAKKLRLRPKMRLLNFTSGSRRHPFLRASKKSRDAYQLGTERKEPSKTSKRSVLLFRRMFQNEHQAKHCAVLGVVVWDCLTVLVSLMLYRRWMKRTLRMLFPTFRTSSERKEPSSASWDEEASFRSTQKSAFVPLLQVRRFSIQTSISSSLHLSVLVQPVQHDEMPHTSLRDAFVRKQKLPKHFLQRSEENASIAEAAQLLNNRAESECACAESECACACRAKSDNLSVPGMFGMFDSDREPMLCHNYIY